VVTDGHDRGADFGEQLTDLLLAVGQPPLGEVDLRIVGEEVELTPPLSKALRYSSATDLRCSSVITLVVSTGGSFLRLGDDYDAADASTMS
jgi:hypothetical protein